MNRYKSVPGFCRDVQQCFLVFQLFHGSQSMLSVNAEPASLGIQGNCPECICVGVIPVQVPDGGSLLINPVIVAGYNSEQFFTGIRYVDGKGERYMGWAVIIRAVNTVDAVTATIPEIPFPVLCRMRDRIIQTVPGVNRVLWDISEKPVATIEFE